ncbi:MFS transporter [Paraburkholderia susongensis]|uniref:MFS transporter, DHA2 family, multidrug resistance protein n=1 Tax=Paraburkholderia susongensis TaxID=1515439 RepID=A0A1X7J6C0_9BURK|nr:MFS transporter [Paraburkholderia susongensis]SMG22480.1 MFS transporter, DHA2 family, multidrug resistance protein [Paraburkholderia susongensis]
MTDGLPNPQRAFAFIAIAIAMTMSVLDTSIVNVALPTICSDLKVSPADAIWVVNAYQLAITVSLLPLAVLGDSLGYKRVYCFGLALFTLASFACANAHTLSLLAVARVFQGFGAAGVMSVNIALVRFIYPKARLGVGVGYTSLVVAVSSAAGPSIASAILSVAHWQWLFLVNVPLGVLALLIGTRTLPATPRSGARLNGLSVLLNAITFGLLISGLAAFSEAGAMWRGIVMVAIALIVGVLFVRRESRLATPILPIDLLRMPVFSLSMATSICSFAAQTMAFIVLPFYFEQTLKLSETRTGFLMTPWPLVTALIAPVAGRLSDRMPPGRISSIGLVVLGFGLAALCTLGEAATPFDITWRLAICGLGFGVFQSPNNRVIIGSAPRNRSGGASGLQSMGRLLGQSGGAVVVSVVFGLVNGQHMTMIAGIAAGLAWVAACASSVRRMADHGDGPRERNLAPEQSVSEH